MIVFEEGRIIVRVEFCALEVRGFSFCWEGFRLAMLRFNFGL